MFRRKREIFVKKDVIPPHMINPMTRRKTFSQTRFDRFDIPGETGKSVKRLLLLILALFGAWFVYECFLYWNIFG